MLTSLGTAGLGFVWGWLIVLMIKHRPSVWRNGLPVALATAGFIAAVPQLQNGANTLLLAGAALLGLLLHIAVLQGLALKSRS